MAPDRMLLTLAVLASAGIGFLLGGGMEEEAGAPADVPAAAAAAPPLETEVGPLFAPIWNRGRIAGYVAAEVQVRFPLAEGGRVADAAPRLPELRDRMLAVLYRAGAEGRLAPGMLDRDALHADLLAATREAGVESLRISRLIHQENRPVEAAPSRNP